MINFAFHAALLNAIFAVVYMKKKDWYENWFCSTYYKILYRDRDEQEAELVFDRRDLLVECVELGARHRDELLVTLGLDHLFEVGALANGDAVRYVDVNGDGFPDLQTVVQKLAPEVDVTLATTYDFWTGAVYSQSAVNGAWGDVDTTVFDNNVLVAPIPLALFNPAAEPTFSVWTHSLYAPNGQNVVDAVTTAAASIQR